MIESRNQIPLVFLALGLPLGLTYALLMPPMEIPDESVHYVRAYGISEGTCLAPAKQTIPESILKLPPGNPLLLTEASTPDGRPPATSERTAVQVASANLYSCVPYLPAAGAIALGNMFAPSPIWLFYSVRCANLFAFLLLTFFAIRFLPDWRLILFCLALMPMTLHQAASLSADSMTLATTFLYCAYVLHLAFSSNFGTLNWRQFAFCLGILLLTSLCKFNIWMVLLLGLIPASRFGSNRRRWIALGLAILLTLVAAAVWQELNRSHITEFQQSRLSIEKNVLENAAFIYQRSGDFASILIWTILKQSGQYANEFVGRLGWLTVRLPIWLVSLYLSFLFVLAVGGARIVRVSGRQKALCSVIVAGSVISLLVLLWTFEIRPVFLTPQAIAAHKVQVPGIQGRYFIPFALPFFILFANAKFRIPAKPLALLSALLVLVANATADFRVHKRYYPRTFTRKNATMTVQTRVVILGIYRAGMWLLDVDGTQRFVKGSPSSNRMFSLGGLPEDIPVSGDWTGSGKWKPGVFRKGMWVLDWNGDNQFTPEADRTFFLGGLKEDIPVTGDWNADGRTKIGVFRQGAWLLDEEGKGQFDEDTQIRYFGGLAGDLPVTGDWNGDGRTKIGIYRQGLWLLDVNGNGRLDDRDATFNYGGLPGDVPVVGDWTGDGRSKVGIFRSGFLWVLDSNGNRKFDASDRNVAFGGLPGDQPAAGRW